ncbi:MAG: DUF4160 domain-containing protein [Kiritimatiellae bacterium]|jgi:hypothetical protein|nr:DUF4160 domain-containing protein [Kiritimatiellia bacterium]
MPEISRFLGISIRFYYREHAPPHFHAVYGEHEAQIALGSHAVLMGKLPGRVLGLVQEWAELHGAELESCWEAARKGVPPEKIEPLV